LSEFYGPERARSRHPSARRSSRALRITDAFAFDGDFTAAGFLELRP
jgi:hypothetical protein